MKEAQCENDLFFVCSLVEYISRKTKNKKSLIISKLGYDNLDKMYKLASVYHCENIDKVSDEFIMKCNISDGNYDIISNVKSRVPNHFEMGKVYKRLIVMVNSNREDYIKTLIKVMSSFIVEKLDNYDSSMYYENPFYIYVSIYSHYKE